MREIKFRYTFQGGIGCKIEHKEFTLEEIENKQNLFDCWKLLARRQFTGLKDKNGKEIYEGDIIKRFMPNDKWQFYEIIFIKGAFTLKNNGVGSILPLGEYLKEKWHKETLEVIGNIYENPELLEPKAK